MRTHTGAGAGAFAGKLVANGHEGSTVKFAFPTVLASFDNYDGIPTNKELDQIMLKRHIEKNMEFTLS